MKKKGIGILEILIASAILSLVLFAFSASLSLYSRVGIDATKRTQGVFLAEEGLEVMRSLRDRSWSTLSSLETNREYGLLFNEGSSEWTVQSDPDREGEFSRSVVIRDVFRVGGELSKDTGTYDGDARFVEVIVSWQGVSSEQSVNLENVLSNIFE